MVLFYYISVSHEPPLLHLFCFFSLTHQITGVRRIHRGHIPVCSVSSVCSFWLCYSQGFLHQFPLSLPLTLSIPVAASHGQTGTGLGWIELKDREIEGGKDQGAERERGKGRDQCINCMGALKHRDSVGGQFGPICTRSLIECCHTVY